MSGIPTHMFCVGATKAGTSWLYRYLHDHPECHLRSEKELHFFDAVDFDEREYQSGALMRRRAALSAKLAGAGGWQESNLTRRIADIDELLAVFRSHGGEGAADAYRAYLTEGAEGRLVADMTPAYALLSEGRLRMMAGFAPVVKFVYLMRDPVERLWSHVRMQAKRQFRPEAGIDLATKASRTLKRIVMRGQETHITARGDYRATVDRLETAVPAGHLLVDFSERLLTAPGLKRLCEFLGLSFRPADTDSRAHEGVDVPMDAGLRDAARRFLAPQYAWAEAKFGPLPANWQANMVRV